MDKCFYQSDSDRIQTYNRWSRNPVRYSIAPRSLFFGEWCKSLFKGCATEPFHNYKFKENQGFLQIARQFSCVLMEYQINLTNNRLTFQNRICVYLLFFAF